MANMLKKAALALLCVGFLSGCAAKTSGDYEVLGELPVSSDAGYREFDFSTTLRGLYPKCETVVIAVVKAAGQNSATAHPVRVLEGDLQEDASFSFILPADTNAVIGAAYFLFLSNDGGTYSALADDSGLIRLNDDDTLIAKGGAKISLSQAMSELDKMQRFVYIPSYFYYQKELESLVDSTTVICTGRVVSIEALPEVKFYVREPGLEEITSVPATSFTIAVQDFLKGDGERSLRVVLTDAMYRNTVVDSAFDQPSYNKQSMPELAEGEQYLFFLMDSPAGKHGDYLLFVNPYQGYVPLYEDNTLIAIPINAPFSYMQNLEEIRMDIEDIVSGRVYANSRNVDGEGDPEQTSPDEEEAELP